MQGEEEGGRPEIFLALWRMGCGANLTTASQ